MDLPVFAPGQTIVAENRWRELLWSAVPQRVIGSDENQLITYLPAGAVSVLATNRAAGRSSVRTTIGRPRSYPRPLDGMANYGRCHPAAASSCHFGGNGTRDYEGQVSTL